MRVVGDGTAANEDIQRDTHPAPDAPLPRLRIESDGHLETLFLASPDSVFLKDGAGRWLAANGPARALFQLQDCAYEGRTDLELGEELPHMRESFRVCVESDEAAWAHGTLLQTEETVPLADGSLGHFHVLKLPLFHPDGSRKGLVVIGRDVTARKQAEEERDRLLAQEQAARAAAQAAELRALLLAEASRVLADSGDSTSALAQVARLTVPALAAACRIELSVEGEPAGTTVLAEAHASAAWARVLQEQAPVLCRARTAALSADAAVIETAPPAVAAMASDVPEVRSALVAPLRARGQLLGTLAFVSGTAGRYGAAEQGLAEDLAQRISLAVENARLFRELKASHDSLARAQEELVRRERLAALGELAAVVAHEVRNPLGAIFNSLATLRRRGAHSEDAPILLDMLEEEASRLSRIVVDLLDFARPYELKREEASLAELVAEALSSATRAHREAAAVAITTHVDPDVPRLQVDPALLRLALLNVASNALQAMPAGGTLVTRLRTVEARAQRWAELSLSDTGRGIPAHLLTRVFEPFFTTRSSGTGLGLAIVKRIVESHGGTIEVTSVQGEGTTVALRLPLEA